MIQSSLRDLLYIVFRHKVKIALVFLGTLSLFVTYTYLVQEIYRSEAKVLIRIGRESLSVDPSISGPTLYAARDRETEVNSELAILTSRAIAEDVVRALTPEVILAKPDESADVIPPSEAMKGVQQELRAVRRNVREKEAMGGSMMVALDLATPLTPEEQAIKFVSENLDVKVESKTDIITVSFDAPSRTLAQNALSHVLDSYQERHIEAYSAQASPEFFEDKTEEYRQHLESSQQALSRFRQEHAISNIERQKEVLLQQLSDLELNSAENAAQATASRRQVASLQEALAKRTKTLEISRTTGLTNYAADELKKRLLELRLEESDLSARFQESYRPLQDVRQKIIQTEELLANEAETHTEVTSGVDPTYQQLQINVESEQAKLEGLEARQTVIDSSLETQRQALARLATFESELDRLERTVKLAESDYERYHENLQRARISNALDLDKVSNVSVVQPATLPMEPVKPNKLLNIMLSVVIALFMAISLAFVLEYLDDSMHTPENIEKWVGVPVLVTVSDKEYKAYAS